MIRPLRQRAALTAIALLVLLAPSLAVELHPSGNHLAASALGDETVYLSGHDQADRSLHVEPVAGTGDVHCPGCILRQQGQSAFAEPPSGVAWMPGRAPFRRPEPVVSLSRTSSATERLGSLRPRPSVAGSRRITEACRAPPTSGGPPCEP